MNVMEIVSGTGVNGAIQHCLSITTELARRGHSVAVVCRADAWIHEKLASKPVEIIESDLHRWPLDEVRRIAGLVKAKRIDVIHTHMSAANYFGVLVSWLSGAPCVATAHAYNRQWHWPLNDRVIAVSESSRRFLRTSHLVSARRIEVIHNFADARFFAALPSEMRSSARASLGVDNLSPLIGYVGSVFIEKGLLDLVQVFAIVLKAEPNARLAIVGAGPTDFCNRLQSMASNLGIGERIVWAGRRLDIPEMLAAFDLFVLPSPKETCSLSSLEAMASGLPVIAWAVRGVSELVENDETGILIPLGLRAAMAEAIVALLRNPDRRKKLGEAGRRRAIKYFSPDRQVPRVEAALMRSTERRGLRRLLAETRRTK